MALLSIHDVCFGYADALLAGARLEIEPGDRIGLVGLNGVGKTTLLRILAGSLEPDRGQVTRRRGVRVEYVQGAESGREGSPGERMRASLSRALLAEPDVLLLDEPDNHLDIAARAWLEQKLLAFRGAVVIVSHDRALLAAVTTHIAELARTRLTVFTGNYDRYRSQRVVLDAHARNEYEAAQRRAARAERAAARRLQLAARVAAPPQGVRANRDFYGRKAAKVARTARILSERAEFEAEAGPKPWEEPEISALDFGDVPRSGEIVLRADRISAPPLFDNLSLELRRAERLAIVGPNGSGKTTLLRMLALLDPPVAGTVQHGARVTMGYFAQEGENLDRSRRGIDICEEAAGNRTRAWTMLGCVRLRGDRASRTLAAMSTGERAKVALARLLLSHVNLLLLDEPANHLEIEAREAVESAIRAYPGSVVVVSHDRRFIANVADRVLSLGPAGSMQHALTG